MSAKRVKRKRYSPDVRRGMILDSAADVVALEGVAQLSMERIARQEGVSKSLIYSYFDSLEALLKELLDRELTSLRRAQIGAAEKAETFEDLVRRVTREYLAYIEERGLIIERLRSEPTISDMTDPTDHGRDAAVDYLAKIVTRHFDIPDDLARAATDISFGLPAAAGEYLLKTGIERQALEDLTVSMITGSFSTIRLDYMNRQRKLDRGEPG